MAFRVGAVGHRPNRLPQDEAGQSMIRQRLDAVLGAVKAAVEVFSREPDAAFYAQGPATLTAISPLAEGADRLFAESALNLGYGLCCPMPFGRDEYERDFRPGISECGGSEDQFRGLLSRAAQGAGLVTFELDGNRAEEGVAYGAAGRLALNQSDLLIVIWDGGHVNGLGGTVDTLRQALEYHVPVIWIDAKAPYGWCLMREPADLARLEHDVTCSPDWDEPDEMADSHQLLAAVSAVVLEELRLPDDPADTRAREEARTHARDYFRETRPRFNTFVPWKLFRDLIAHGRLRWIRLRVRPFVEQIRGAWPVEARDLPPGAPPPPPEFAAVNAALREHYAWSDKRADLYADAHRSTNIATSFFAALAVFLALIPMAAGWTAAQVDAERATIIFEFLILLLIVSLLSLGRWRRWHSRWLEYRVLAELIRQLRLLLPLGGGRPAPRTPAHLATYGEPTRSWMYWQIRAIARAVGIPSAVVTPGYIARCLDDLYDIADGPQHGQLAFHEANHHRSEAIHERLHVLTFVLFWGTVIAVVAHFAFTFFEIGDRAAGRWLLLASALAPSLGAALANINNQGEFARLAKRSRAMAEGFTEFARRIEALRMWQQATSAPPSIAEVTAVARAMTEAMVDENVDWRVVVLDLAHAGG